MVQRPIERCDVQFVQNGEMSAKMVGSRTGQVPLRGECGGCCKVFLRVVVRHL